MDNLEKEALNWWNSLTEYGRSQFPVPQSNDDIISYYKDPAGFTMLPDTI